MVAEKFPNVHALSIANDTTLLGPPDQVAVAFVALHDIRHVITQNERSYHKPQDVAPP